MSNPFIKVTWEDIPENFTPEKIRRVKSYFEKKYNAKSVQVITKTLTNVNQTRLESLEASDNILDHQYQKKLMKDFLKDNNIVIKEELMERLDNKVNVQIDKLNENKVRYNKWYIRKVEFSNFLSFKLKNINVDTKNKNINIIGDKGYINSTVFLHDDKKVNTIAPNRKNMKKRSSKYNKSKLKKRYLIENVFASLKKFNRTMYRKERNIKNFMSFIYIACMVILKL